MRQRMPVQREVSRGPHRSIAEGSVAIRRNQRRREGLKGTSKHVSTSSREGAVAVWQSLSGEAVGPMAWVIAATR